MTLRADHVAGAFFIGLGLLVIALSGDLPAGSLSLPGSGFMPKISAVLTMLFGTVLLLRARESKEFATLSWSDAQHAAMVVAIAAAGIFMFERLGFIITNVLLVLTLLVIVERRRLVFASVYSVGLVLGAYVLFAYVLKTPLRVGPLGF